jgi:hypothetical protein
MDMNCEKIKNLLSRYIDGRLERKDITEVENHLVECRSCTAHYEKLLQLKKMADDFELGGDELFWNRQKDKIMEGIAAAEKSKVVEIPRRRRMTKVYQWTALAASIALIAFISVREYQQYFPERKLSKPAPEAVRTMEPSVQPKQEKPTEAPTVPPARNETVQGSIADKKADVRKKEEKPTPPDELKSAEKDLFVPAVIPAEKERTVAVEPSETEIAPEAKLKKEAPERPEAISYQDQIVKVKDEVEPIKTQSIAKEQPPIEKKEKKGQAKETVGETNPVPEKAVHKLVETKGWAEKATGTNQLSIDVSKVTKSISADTLILYVEWRRKAETIEAEYNRLLNQQKKNEDSVRLVLGSLAEAYYNVGVYAETDSMRRLMVRHLEELSPSADSTNAVLIRNYIVALRDIIK